MCEQSAALVLLESATKKYQSVGNTCGVLHALAALAPLVQGSQLGSFVRALELGKGLHDSEDDLAADELRVLKRVTL